jgi:TRAP-type mannitol/chloroaromatic compound transport system permease small subunit
MEQFIFLVDKFNTWIGKAFGWCILLLTTAVAYEVFVRYLLNDPTSWAFDMSYMMYGSLFMIGGAYTLARDGHVRGDVIYRLWPAKVQASVELVLYFLLFFPGVLALIMAGTDYAGESWSYNYGTGEVSINSPANVPISQFKTVLPVAAGLLFLQGIAQVCRCIVCLKTSAWPAHLEDVEEMETILQQHHEYEMAHKAHEAHKAQEDDAKGDAT